MKLYVCYGTWKYAPRSGGMHPCGRAYHALKDAGHDPEVIKGYGLTILPDNPFNNTAGRKEAKRLTGKSMLPVLVTDDGEVISDSRKIAEWAEKNPAAAPAGATS
jgi:Glutathione S-transferase, N-terminal domain